ncbi:outer membrane beta-barrel protein [Gaoshiqia sediminis]|nr:outer membrane beta-barrel protein [Gaoshiqia sediminis]
MQKTKQLNMFKFILALCLVLYFMGQAMAQQPDSIRYIIKSRKANIINLQRPQIDGFNYWEEEFRGHWAGVFLGVNGFFQSDYNDYPADQQDFLDINLWRSNSLNINLIQFSKGLQHNRNTIGLVTGIGLETQTYYLDKNTSLVTETDRVVPVTLFFDSNQKSKFSSIYLNIPLLLEFQVPIKQGGYRFYISGGVTASKNLSTHTKIKYKKNNQKQKLKTPDDFHMHDYRYAATLRLGYRGINLFATCDLRPLFKEGKGPEVYPFSVGFALISF